MAKADSILIASGTTFVSEPVPAAQLVFGGLEGDRHFGVTRAACSRASWQPRGTTIANTRQISILSVEELAEMAALMDLDQVDPRLLGANVVTQGIAQLTGLAPATRLQFPSGATLFVSEENLPCRYPGEKLAEAHRNPELQSRFAKVAIGRRGLVALVEREGRIAVGDEITVIAPRPRREPMPVPTA